MADFFLPPTRNETPKWSHRSDSAPPLHSIAMSPPAAPSPTPRKDDDVDGAIRALSAQGAVVGGSPADPRQLFAHGSNLAAESGGKRYASPRRTSTLIATSSPAKKKTNTSASPACIASGA